MYTAGRKFYKDSLEKSTYFLAENFYDYFYFLDFNLPLQVIIGGGGRGGVRLSMWKILGTDNFWSSFQSVP